MRATSQMFRQMAQRGNAPQEEPSGA
jgi:hypothetical protein